MDKTIFDKYTVKITADQAADLLKMVSTVDFAKLSVQEVMSMNDLTYQLERITEKASL